MEQIEVTSEAGICQIAFNRPEKLNAFTKRMRTELIEAFEFIDNDDDIRAAIVTGKGRAFCAGADLGAGGRTFDRERLGAPSITDLRDGGGQVTLRIFNCRKPVIAAINGPAVGVGITMTLAMDFRLAVPEAKIGFVFSRRGIVPEAASTWFLPRIVGHSRAADWMYSGRIFPASEGHGLFHSLHEPDELLDAAYSLAREITAESSPVSVALTRQMLWRNSAAPHPMDAHMIDSRAMYAMGRSPDAEEGIAAFLEKRPAKFPMKVSTDVPGPWWDDPEFSWDD